MQVNNKNQVYFHGNVISGKKAGRLNKSVTDLIKLSTPPNVDTFFIKGDNGVRTLTAKKNGVVIGRKANLHKS